MYYFEGIAMLLVGDWAYVLFLAAADRELLCSLTWFLFALT